MFLADCGPARTRPDRVNQSALLLEIERLSVASRLQISVAGV
jgi:hypothetical protein